jgi:hypothetical protein
MIVINNIISIYQRCWRRRCRIWCGIGCGWCGRRLWCRRTADHAAANREHYGVGLVANAQSAVRLDHHRVGVCCRTNRAAVLCRYVDNLIQMVQHHEQTVVLQAESKKKIIVVKRPQKHRYNRSYTAFVDTGVDVSVAHTAPPGGLRLYNTYQRSSV